MWDIFTTGPAFHPTAIHVEKMGANELDQGDFLIEYQNANCPNQNLWGHENWKNPKIRSILHDHPQIQAAVNALGKAVGQDLKV